MSDLTSEEYAAIQQSLEEARDDVATQKRLLDALTEQSDAVSEADMNAVSDKAADVYLAFVARPDVQRVLAAAKGSDPSPEDIQLVESVASMRQQVSGMLVAGLAVGSDPQREWASAVLPLVRDLRR
jgi:hypothetical protein